MTDICKHCGFSLTIKKASDIRVTKISTVNEFIIASKNDEQQEYDILLDYQTLEAYLAKKNMKAEEKRKLLDLFITMTNTKRSVTKFILKCTTCGSEYVLQPETTIYSLNFKKQQSLFNDDYIDLKLYDPTLPRTKDFICINVDCLTHSADFDQSTKEAVFYRADGSYHMKYACLTCKTNWQI